MPGMVNSGTPNDIVARFLKRDAADREIQAPAALDQDKQRRPVVADRPFGPGFTGRVNAPFDLERVCGQNAAGRGIDFPRRS